MELLFYFIFFYPLFMAYFWMMGSLIFYLRRERGRGDPPPLTDYPFVSVLVPCHNEAATIARTMAQLEKNGYPNYEIIAINDGSTDATSEILHRLAKQVSKLRIITLAKNYGKAMALRSGAMASEAEFLMCIDADALLDSHAIHWMMLHFQQGPRVGAVTGNPRVLNKHNLLSRIQVGEFAAIIGMVKRSQRDIGRLFTVSGVNVCYRRRALHDVGYWSPETVTEDIDISWKLQLKYWDIRYEPRSLSWIFVPESLNGLWRQRLRWARGGAEAALKYAYLLKQWDKRRMWPVYVEYLIGALWCYAFVAVVLFWLGTEILPDYWPEALRVNTLVPGWTGVLLAVTCLLQFSVGLFLDSHYEKGIIKNLYWAIWYPAIYWVLSCLTTVAAIPQAIFHNGSTRHATWKSPERGNL